MKLLRFSGLCIVLGALGYLIHIAQPVLRRSQPMLPLSFAHADHATVNCVKCHHNFIDDSGHGLCFDCHKTDQQVNALIEEQFHELCRDCHEKQQKLGEDGGPVRRCLDCHSPDEAP